MPTIDQYQLQNDPHQPLQFIPTSMTNDFNRLSRQFKRTTNTRLTPATSLSNSSAVRNYSFTKLLHNEHDHPFNKLSRFPVFSESTLVSTSQISQMYKVQLNKLLNKRLMISDFKKLRQ